MPPRALKMALLRYFKPKEGLPDPKGSLSLSVPSQAIYMANKEVQAVIDKEKKQRGPYKKYTPKQRAEIGKYAYHHGITAAAKHFSTKLKTKISENTVASMKKDYLEALRQKRTAQDEGDVTELPPKKRGRPVLLGSELDTLVQTYLRKVRERGGAVSARIAMAAAQGIC